MFASKITEHIYVSDWNRACNEQFLTDNEISVIFNVTTNAKTPNITAVYDALSIVEYMVPIAESATTGLGDEFEKVYDTIHRNVLNGKNILFHCQHGGSRACAIIISYYVRRLKLMFKDSPDRNLRRQEWFPEVFKFVRSCYPAMEMDQSIKQQTRFLANKAIE